LIFQIVGKEPIISKQNSCEILILKVLEAETMINSEDFGIRGKPDCVLECQVSCCSEVCTIPLPFELKTGKKTSYFHSSQVIYYILLLIQKHQP